jgi:hypothetical protein
VNFLHNEITCPSWKAIKPRSPSPCLNHKTNTRLARYAFCQTVFIERRAYWEEWWHKFRMKIESDWSTKVGFDSAMISSAALENPTNWLSLKYMNALNIHGAGSLHLKDLSFTGQLFPVRVLIIVPLQVALFFGTHGPSVHCPQSFPWATGWRVVVEAGKTNERLFAIHNKDKQCWKNKRHDDLQTLIFTDNKMRHHEQFRVFTHGKGYRLQVHTALAWSLTPSFLTNQTEVLYHKTMIQMKYVS